MLSDGNGLCQVACIGNTAFVEALVRKIGAKFSPVESFYEFVEITGFV